MNTTYTRAQDPIREEMKRALISSNELWIHRSNIRTKVLDNTRSRPPTARYQLALFVGPCTC